MANSYYFMRPVVYFFDAVQAGGDPRAGRVAAGLIYNRPTSSPTADIFVFDPDSSQQPFYNSGVSHGQSLQECIEVGNKWVTLEEAEAWGIDLDDGDQDITEL